MQLKNCADAEWVAGHDDHSGREEHLLLQHSCYAMSVAGGGNYQGLPARDRGLEEKFGRAKRHAFAVVLASGDGSALGTISRDGRLAEKRDLQNVALDLLSLLTRQSR